MSNFNDLQLLMYFAVLVTSARADIASFLVGFLSGVYIVRFNSGSTIFSKLPREVFCLHLSHFDVEDKIEPAPVQLRGRADAALVQDLTI